MKTTLRSLRSFLLLTAWLAPGIAALAVTFTSDTLITLSNTSYDGQEIVVSNCTLTIDGAHNFANVHLLGGGILTHSFSQTGLLDNTLSVTGELQVLSTTNPPTLNLPNVIASTVVVSDATGVTNYINGTDYAVSANNGLTSLTLLSPSAIADGATVSVSYSAQGAPVAVGLNLSVSNNVEIEPGAAINVAGRGYGPARGTGAGLSTSTNFPFFFYAGGGGGHIGPGGPSSTGARGGSSYGSFLSTSEPGSGGGAGTSNGGAGGGVVHLTVRGLLRVDGPINADGAKGTNAHSGGGAGGSVWVSAQAISGTASISANGGAGEPIDGGGGGGGGILLSSPSNQFVGSLSARGGLGAGNGGAGTIFSALIGQLLVDNGGARGAPTPLSVLGAFDLTVSGGAVLQSGGAMSLTTLTLRSNGWLMPAAAQLLAAGVMGNVSISADSGFNGDSKGFVSNGTGGGGGKSVFSSSPYNVYTGGGGGYGGYGGASGLGAGGGSTDGSMLQPSQLGSGGGAGGNASPPNNAGGTGGGALALTVGGTLTLDGQLTVNGGAGTGQGSGGGSGGSIYLNVATMAGAGLVSANGGDGELPLGGGGGGGRIALYYLTNGFTGMLAAHGGRGATNGGAGTIYSSGSNVVSLVLDNGGLTGPTNTPVSISGVPSLSVLGGAGASIPTGSFLRSLLLGSNSWLGFSSQTATLTVTNNATIEAGGGILLDAQGSQSMSGSGAGRTGVSYQFGTIGSGAGFGGPGGAAGSATSNAVAGGATYGSMSAPNTAGSGGGNGSLAPFFGGAGGGGLQLNVAKTLSLDGRISANGGAAIAAGAGGGSGGGVWLNVGTLTGAGLISANGGAGDLPYGGGGGGGRIAVFYTNNNLFAGSLTARGGSGVNYGGAGTIYLKSYTNSYAQVVLDNGGARATNTPLSVAGPVDLTLTGGAVAMVFNAPDFSRVGTLFIASNSWLIYTSSFSPVVLSITNATVQAGGGISLDGAGSAPGLGAGPGRSVSGLFGITGGGGGHGGSGGFSFFGAAGGIAYDSLVPGFSLSSTSLGSGGGNGTGNSPYNLGGFGGGALQLTVSGSLVLDGRLSADGSTGLGQGSGGGSGGTLFVTVGKISGAGTISANGGPGDLPFGGGGGGGRIALYYTTNQFTGTFSAHGGLGAMSGGAGTIYLKPDAQLGKLLDVQKVIIDNGGFPGASNTMVSGVSDTLDLTVSGWAVANLATPGVFPSPSFTSLRSLFVGANSWLTFGALSSQRTLTVTSNATVQSGGGITLDGLGYADGGGSGAGRSVQIAAVTTSGGGGYAGYGGRSSFGALGGNTYGSATGPTDAGSSGGNTSSASPNNQGGAGGGSLKLTVNGTLALDGRLSADGVLGAGPGSGGGSGGSLWLTVGKLTGAGSISATGGSGDPSYGGGGGGGRIALYYSTNLFTGSLAARGGPGAVYGGAGTVYISGRTGNNTPQVIVDNGGSRGTNTPLSQLGFCDLTISGGAFGNFSPSGVRNLVVSSNAWLGGPLTPPSSLTLTVYGNATIQRGGVVTLDAAGWPGNQGSGHGNYGSRDTIGYTGSGGAYGGGGGPGLTSASGGIPYGSLTAPTDPGSGGGGFSVSSLPTGGPGGGAVILTVVSNLTVDGSLSADGGGALFEGSGGGSGGTVSLNVTGTLGGAGKISANGGAGDLNQGGGGGGGRISLLFKTNQFTGTLSAYGGPGLAFGGAGTIYSKATAALTPQVLIDNGGTLGTNTPFAVTQYCDLMVTGGALVNPSAPPLVLNSLFIDSGGRLTHLSSQSNLDLTVLGDAFVGTNGFMNVDSKGYQGVAGGPGAGQMSFNSAGSGGGYGGVGGAGSSGIAGGTTYGSAQRPTDRGSRGGIYPSLDGLSQGGGAIRLKVGGTLTVDGELSANGNFGVFDGYGGGAGGSIWLTARKFDGTGFLLANGGAGAPTDGGGGGGGRIAVYCRTNNFGGWYGAYGAPGANWGADGTVYLATNIPAPQIIAQSPSDIVSYAVSSVDFTFDSPMDAASMSAAVVPLDTPNGFLPAGSVGAAATGLNAFRINFPAQSTLGYYEVQVGPQVLDIYGDPMAAPYVGSFVILPPLLSGRVLDTNGVGVPYVTLHISDDSVPVLTDSHGNYSIEVFPSWAGSITPARGTWTFIPPSRTYTNVSMDLTNQDFVMAPPAALLLSSQAQDGNLNLGCFGLNRVTYQLLSSSDLVNWAPYGAAVVGTNGPLNLTIPIGPDPSQFFRFSASY